MSQYNWLGRHKASAYNRARRRADVNMVDESKSSPGTQMPVSIEMPAGEGVQDTNLMHSEDTQKNAASEDDEDEQPIKKRGAMLAIYPTWRAAEKIANTYAELDADPDYLHVTLVYLGKDLTDDDIESVIRATSEVCAAHPELECSLQGLGMFNHTDEDEGGRPFYASVNAQGMAALRTDLVRALFDVGVIVPSNYDFTPHMTLAYTNPDKVDFGSGAPGVEWVSRKIELVMGDEHIHSFELGGDHESDFGMTANMSMPTVDRMMSLNNGGENISEDPDLKLGEKEEED